MAAVAAAPADTAGSEWVGPWQARRSTYKVGKTSSPCPREGQRARILFEGLSLASTPALSYNGINTPQWRFQLTPYGTSRPQHSGLDAIDASRHPGLVERI